MAGASRRKFLGASMLGLAAPPLFAKTLARAAALPAQARSGSIADVEHIVVLMQENRSFDSYYGTLAGVRGFSDPRAITLPSGKPVWYQPDGSKTVLPYHFDIKNTNALRIGLDHSWKGSEQTWKDWNAWIAKKSVRSLGYFNRQDLPFYYALADAFTVCDAYHCAVFGPTDPNRFYALSGHSGGNVTGIGDGRLYNVTNGVYNADIANDNPAAAGIEWPSYAEQLEGVGISWKVYQEWDNYGDNYLQYFKNFRVDAQGRPLTPASPLYQKGRAYAPGSTAANASGTSGQWLIDQFAADVRADRLPQVSWICAPTEYCEHPEATPNAGENFSARLLAALVSNPAVWAKTALIITYDENDGFFDHMPPTMPALNSDRGRSTLANATQGEVYQGEPIGLGPRVPTTVVSPWSKGGRVCSQLFDHTSLIRFIEEWAVQGRGLARERVHCAAISPWRRAVSGDLTSAFNFLNPNAAWPATVPATALYFKGWGSASALPPAQQVLPRQESVSGAQARPACALPYRCATSGKASASAQQFMLSLANGAATGSAAAAFIVYSTLRSDGPWHYTVEAGKRIDNEVWNWSSKDYALAVHSHNGFVREYRGNFAGSARLAEVSVQDDAASRSVRIDCFNGGSASLSFKLSDLSYGDKAQLSVTVPAGQTRSLVRNVEYSQGWYDLGVTVDGDSSYWRRLSGHLEGCGLDYTDPVLNGLAVAQASPPPLTVPPPASTVTFSGNAKAIRVGESLSVAWQGLPAGSKHWIGIYRKGWVPGSNSSLKWNYVAAPAGSQVISGLAEGEYFIGLFLNDGYGEAAPRLDLRVLKPGDLNGDGRIDAADREQLRNALGACAGQPRYQPLANLDADSCITQVDYRAWYDIFNKQ
ncbi:phospholipase C, phosphocholine-specific [Paucibacter sp. APW11]|uniref:phospholipase C n=1 Tax=Roseateles aquae TaxID=3077235 RepID=A0ABU3P8G3_9BURK|nr:phospholipase C, phosphocholine-specific [Paucibacter sp. APW11]MDT8998587.1 phospholipase C, phosphocholine-specific [Paucibacter sp. APW11]